jgi:hypothetical protein
MDFSILQQHHRTCLEPNTSVRHKALPALRGINILDLAS